MFCANFHSSCGWCFNCVQGHRDQCLSNRASVDHAELDGKLVFSDLGGMTEVMVVKEEKRVPVFSDLSSTELSMLSCVGNSDLGLASAHCPVEFGSDVVVSGAGPWGLSATQGASIGP